MPPRLYQAWQSPLPATSLAKMRHGLISVPAVFFSTAYYSVGVSEHDPLRLQVELPRI